MDLKKIGSQIRQARLAKGLSQEELAVLANSSQSTIDRIEKGGKSAALINAAIEVGVPLDNYFIDDTKIEQGSVNAQLSLPDRKSKKNHKNYIQVSLDEFRTIVFSHFRTLRADITPALDQVNELVADLRAHSEARSGKGSTANIRIDLGFEELEVDDQQKQHNDT